MSRIGKKPIEIPSGVKVSVQGQTVSVEGPKGKLKRDLHPAISAKVEGNKVVVARKGDNAAEKALHGLCRSLLNNMIEGVAKGYEKQLEIVGIGYRAKVEGKVLNITLGFSHPINYNIPEGITISVEKNTILKIVGADKELVGAVAADLRRYYPPEPYKGKGIKYIGEHIRRKAGKTVA